MELDRALEGIDDEKLIKEINWLLEDLERGRITLDKFRRERREAISKVGGVSDPLIWPVNVKVDSVPLFLAHAWKQYAEEDHSRVKLHLILEFVELSVRFSVAVLISQIRSAHEGQLPDQLSSKLSQLVRSPTLGQWLGILRELSAYPSEAVPLPKMFELYGAMDLDTWLSNKEDLSEVDSILVLRNHVAHGGGFSNKKASEWADAHKDRVEGMLKKILDALGDARFVSADEKLLLMGVLPSKVETEWLPEDASGCWMQVEDVAMPLWPLADYAPVRRFDRNGQLKEVDDHSAAQIYASLNKKNLHFTPLGNDACISQHKEIESFRKLFALQNSDSKKGEVSAYQWSNFIDDAGQEAEQLVGRAEQLKSLKAWVKGRDSRSDGVASAVWIHGKPGMGKSMLVAKAVTDWASGANGEKENGLYYHRFRAGDGRNSLRMFMKLLQQALWEWQPLQAMTTAPDALLEDDELLKDLEDRLGCVKEMQANHVKVAAPRYLLVVDGLDEVVAHEPKLMKALRSLLLPGVLLVVSSRKEQGLGDEVPKLGAEDLFPEGLPRLNEHEIRAMLENELTSAALLTTLVEFDLKDTPQDVIPENSYIQKVLAHSEGLPLYIRLLVEDLKTSVRKLDDDTLPDSLRAYYDEIMNRIGLSDVRVDLTKIVATLAVSREPLERDALAQIIANGRQNWDDYTERVGVALEAGASLLRMNKSKDDGDGFTTYHQSYREYLLGESSPLKGSVVDARCTLLELTEQWGKLPGGNLKNHLFRQATAYAVEAGVDHSGQAARRLCNFGYLMERLASLPASEVASLASEYRLLERYASQAVQTELCFSDWTRFIQSNAHLLCCGGDQWPANRILLQLAIDQGGMTAEKADQWLKKGCCDWLWFRNKWGMISSLNDLKELQHDFDEVISNVEKAGDNLVAVWDERKNFTGLWDLKTNTIIQPETQPVADKVTLSGRLHDPNNPQTIVRWPLSSGKRLHVIYELVYQDEHGDYYESSATIRYTSGEIVGTLPVSHAGRLFMRPVGGDSFVSWGDQSSSICLWDLAKGECSSNEGLDGQVVSLSDGNNFDTKTYIDVFDGCADDVIALGNERVFVASYHSGEICLSMYDSSIAPDFLQWSSTFYETNRIMMLSTDQFIGWGSAGLCIYNTINGEACYSLIKTDELGDLDTPEICFKDVVVLSKSSLFFTIEKVDRQARPNEKLFHYILNTDSKALSYLGSEPLSLVAFSEKALILKKNIKHGSEYSSISWSGEIRPEIPNIRYYSDNIGGSECLKNRLVLHVKDQLVELQLMNGNKKVDIFHSWK